MRLRALSIALLSATTLAACGGDDEEPAPNNEGTDTATLQITAKEGPYAFDPAQLETDSGEITIEMDSPENLKAPHAVSIEGNGVNEDGNVVQPGAVGEVTADLEAGEYTYYCPVGDHRQQGMEGTLTVN